jgi:hypothetical protein
MTGSGGQFYNGGLITKGGNVKLVLTAIGKMRLVKCYLFRTS